MVQCGAVHCYLRCSAVMPFWCGFCSLVNTLRFTYSLFLLFFIFLFFVKLTNGIEQPCLNIKEATGPFQRVLVSRTFVKLQ